MSVDHTSSVFNSHVTVVAAWASIIQWASRKLKHQLSNVNPVAMVFLDES